MISTFKPQTQLTQNILEAIIRKVGYTIDSISIDEYDAPFYECENFVWNPGIPAMPAILINVKDPELSVVKLFWNGKLDEDFDLETNIPWSAEENLQFYIKLENTIFPVLDELMEANMELIELKRERTTNR